MGEENNNSSDFEAYVDVVKRLDTMSTILKECGEDFIIQAHKINDIVMTITNPIRFINDKRS